MLSIDDVRRLLISIVDKHATAYRFDLRCDVTAGCCSVNDRVWDSVLKVNPWHIHPRKLLSTSNTVIVYAVPLTLEAINSNAENDEPSIEWLREYIIVNEIIESTSNDVVKHFKSLGYRSISIKPTGEFDKKTLVSMWSHRHAGYIAGLGTFGINNLLITEIGCCVRLGTIITEAPIEASERPGIEYCLEKRGVSCRICISRCPVNALNNWKIGKYKCYNRLEGIGAKYIDLLGGKADACGKCATGIPCSTKIP